MSIIICGTPVKLRTLAMFVEKNTLEKVRILGSFPIARISRLH